MLNDSRFNANLLGLTEEPIRKGPMRSIGSASQKTAAQKEVEKKVKTFTKKQKEAFEVAMTGSNMFITGGGGVGKSYLLKGIVYALRNVKNKNVMVCAPTGVASINAGDGVTLHRQFGLPIEPCLTKDCKRPLERVNKTLKCCDTLVIDEISMVRIDVFDSVCASIKKANSDRMSKGASPIQLIVMGDYSQLPPVITDDDRDILERYYNNKKHSLTGKLGSGYAFNSVNWGKMNFHNIILDEVMRQKDSETIYHLNKIREGKHGFTNYFNHVTRTTKNEDAVTLRPYNVNVEAENREKLAKLKGKEYIFEAELFNSATKDDCDGRYELHLKIGAKVMFLANDSPKRANDIIKDRPEAYQDEAMFVNGTTGIVRDIKIFNDDINEDYITVEIPSIGEMVNLKKSSYDVYVYEEKNGKIFKKNIGSWKQFALTPCYAMSIHKSQGLSLEKINIDPRSFTHGQLYVALSRCVSAEQIFLTDFIREDALIMDEEVANFYKQLKETN